MFCKLLNIRFSMNLHFMRLFGFSIAKHFVPNKRLLNKFKSSTENIKEENSVNLSFKHVEDFFNSSHYCYRQH